MAYSNIVQLLVKTLLWNIETRGAIRSEIQTKEGKCDEIFSWPTKQ